MDYYDRDWREIFSSFEPLRSSQPHANSMMKVSGHEGSQWSGPHSDMDPSDQYLAESQYHLPPSQGDSGIFGTDGSDANHSMMSQKVHHPHYGRPPVSERRYPELPPSFRPKLQTSVSIEDHLESLDLMESIGASPSTSSSSRHPGGPGGRRQHQQRYIPTHTLSQQDPHEWRHTYNVGSPASLSQSSHPPLRQQYVEGRSHHLYPPRKTSGSPASSDSSSCYNSVTDRLRSAPGSVISFPESTFSSSTASSLNSSRSGSKGILPRPSAHLTSSSGSGGGGNGGGGNGNGHAPYHSAIPDFMLKSQSEVPKNFSQYQHSSHQPHRRCHPKRRYESESPEEEGPTSMPSLPTRKPNPVRPAPPPPSSSSTSSLPPHEAPPTSSSSSYGRQNVDYRPKRKIDKIPEEGRNRESLKMKLDMLIHLIKVFSSKTGKENDKDAANLLLALSRTPETVEVMHQAACLNMLVQIIHNVEHKEDGEHHNVRLRASETLRNIVQSKSDTRQGRHDMCVLGMLEKVRCHCDEIFMFVASHPPGQRVGGDDQETLQASCDALLVPIRKLYKYSNDKEKFRPSIISLGGLQAAAEVLIVNCRLLSVQKKSGGRLVCHSSKIVAVIISILINLTYGDVQNKSTLCAFPDFLKALVYHIDLQKEPIIASAAQVLRNLSWRATADIKEALLYHDAAAALMGALDHCREEATIQYITSALWNMSAHSLESRERISSVPNSIRQLVNLLSYNSPSGTTSVVENVGGILKNLSVVIKDEKYRKRFREVGGLDKLAMHLKSKNKTVLANATGILWNLSAHHTEDQKILWDLGCIPLLEIHRTSEHKSIQENARGALRNLLAFGQNNGWCSRSDVAGYNLKTQRGLSKSLSIAASYTFNHLIQPQSQHSSESLNNSGGAKSGNSASASVGQPSRSKSAGNRTSASSSSLSQPGRGGAEIQPSQYQQQYEASSSRGNGGRPHYYQRSFELDDGGSFASSAPAKPKNKDRLKFTRIASAPGPQSAGAGTDMMGGLEDERFSYKPSYGHSSAGSSKHSVDRDMEASYPDERCGYPDERPYDDHGYPEMMVDHRAGASRMQQQQQRGSKPESRGSTGLSPYGYSYSQEMHGLSTGPLSNDQQSDTTTSLSVLESKLDKFDPNQPLPAPELSYVELEPDDEEDDDIDQPIRRGGAAVPTTGAAADGRHHHHHHHHEHPSQSFALSRRSGNGSRDQLVGGKSLGTGKLALDGTSDEGAKSKNGKRSSEV